MSEPFVDLIDLASQRLGGVAVAANDEFFASKDRLVIADPPYLVNFRPRDGRTVESDRSNAWLHPSFAEAYRLLKPNTFCVSFYGWPHVEQFMSTWKTVGFSPVSHLIGLKDYSSRSGYTESYHETLYLLAKGHPPRPPIDANVELRDLALVTRVGLGDAGNCSHDLEHVRCVLHDTGIHVERPLLPQWMIDSPGWNVSPCHGVLNQ